MRAGAQLHGRGLHVRCDRGHRMVGVARSDTQPKERALSLPRRRRELRRGPGHRGGARRWLGRRRRRGQRGRERVQLLPRSRAQGRHRRCDRELRLDGKLLQPRHVRRHTRARQLDPLGKHGERRRAELQVGHVDGDPARRGCRRTDASQEYEPRLDAGDLDAALPRHRGRAHQRRAGHAQQAPLRR